MELHEFTGATKLKAAHDALKIERDELRGLLLDIWEAANPSILEDDPTGVRLPPELLRRVESIVSKSAFEQFQKEFAE